MNTVNNIYKYNLKLYKSKNIQVVWYGPTRSDPKS